MTAQVVNSGVLESQAVALKLTDQIWGTRYPTWYPVKTIKSRKGHKSCFVWVSGLFLDLQTPGNLMRKQLLLMGVMSPLLVSRLEEDRLGTVRYDTTAADEFLLEDSVIGCSVLEQNGLLPMLYGWTAFSTRSFISSADDLLEKPNPRKLPFYTHQTQ